MSNVLFIVDPGHGGVINGVNQSKDGKYSPKFKDGTRFYEGVNNRDNAKRLIDHLSAIGIECVDVTEGSDLDVPLTKRVSVANKLGDKRNSLYISIHSDAQGNGDEWMPASGISVYTSVGQTKSDAFATILISELESEFKQTVKWRQDTADGDKDKESNFFVLKNTSMPAVLIEAGFHTNEAEVKRMMTDDWKIKLVNAITNACIRWEELVV